METLREHGLTLQEAVSYFIKHAVKVRKPGILLRDIMDEMVIFKEQDGMRRTAGADWFR